MSGVACLLHCRRLQARHLVETRRLSVVFPHTRVASLVKILKTTAHGAFPVVSLLGSEGESESLVSFENQKVSLLLLLCSFGA